MAIEAARTITLSLGLVDGVYLCFGVSIRHAWLFPTHGAHARSSGSAGMLRRSVAIGELLWRWLRGLDLNQRPSGYEPDELPDCSTPRYRMCVVWMVSRDEKAAARETRQRLFEIVNGFIPRPSAIMPGDDLLFQCLSTSTIGAVRFHVRVRDGIGWVTDAIATKQ